MNRLSILFLTVLLTFGAAFLFTGATGIKVLYVDPVNGSDSNPGSKGKPFLSIEKARDEIRRNHSAMSGDITVYLRGGEYNYSDRYTVRQAGSGEKIYTVRTGKLTFDERDSGKDGYKIIYKAYPGEHPVISGGKRITGWQLHDPNLNIYKAVIGTGIDTRQLYVDGQRAIVARSEGLPSDLTVENDYGHTTTDTSMASWKNIRDIEFIYHEQWVELRLKVSEITLEKHKAKIIMHPATWKFATAPGGNIRIKTPSNLKYIENAYELLDSEGEWYLDRQTGDLFYKPRSGEDISTAEVIIPVVDELLTASGSSPDNRFENVSFEGITFEYAGWLRPNSVKSHIANQNNTLRDEGNRLPEAAVTIKTAQQVRFIRNTFTMLGSTGLFLHDGIRDITITGNRFVILSGGGMCIEESCRNPPDLENIVISNNYIRRIGLEYRPSTAISVAQGKNIYIGHNEISGIPYTGIHMSWHNNGTNNEHITIENNYIRDVAVTTIYDAGAIYALGANPLGNEDNPAYTIQGNYILNQLNMAGVLYADNYSTWWLARNNVIDLKDSPPHWDKDRVPTVHHTNAGENLRFINNYVTTDKTDYWIPGDKIGKWRKETNSYQWNVIPDAVWPHEAIGIIAKAGLEEPYRDLWDAEERFNLIQNPGFETRQENVWVAEDAQWNRITSENRRDNTSAKITPDARGGHIFQTIRVWKGMRYQVSAWAKPGPEKDITASLYAITGEGEQSESIKLDEVILTKGEWNLLKGEFNYSGDEISAPAKIFVRTDSPGGSPYYLDELRVVETGEISKEMLREAIASAGKLYNSAAEGTDAGMYTQGSKAGFLAGIEDAGKAAADGSGKQQVYFALKALYANQVWFQNRKIN